MRPNLQSAIKGFIRFVFSSLRAQRVFCFISGQACHSHQGIVGKVYICIWSKLQRVCLQRNRPFPPSLLLTFGLAAVTGGTYVTTVLCAAGSGLPLGTYLPPYLPVPENTPMNHQIERAGSECVTSALLVWNDHHHFRTGTFRHRASSSGLPAERHKQRTAFIERYVSGPRASSGCDRLEYGIIGAQNIMREGGTAGWMDG